MAETFTVPPGCTGLRIEGSSARYPADSSGHVVVDNPRHAEKVRVNGAAYMHKRINGFTDADENRCPNTDCRFVGFRFTRVCPRCSTPMGPDAAEQADAEEAMS